MRQNDLRTYLLTTAVLVSAVLSACSTDTTNESKPATTPTQTIAFRNVENETEFVGDEACSSCHEEEYAGYQSHGMANSMERADSDSLLGPLPSPSIYHEPTNLFYRAFEDNGSFFQEEYRLDDAGQVTHRLVRSIDWVVGSGTAARTFLTEENGHYTEMPLTWYTQNETWDMSPGYDVLNNRFSREIPDRCMACHNAYPDGVTNVKGKYDAVGSGISCERCHGPGQLHVDARLENPEPRAEIDDTIVNPAHLDIDLRLDVCQQCHLNGSVSILREGRTAYQFRPSEPLSAHLSLYSESAGEFKVISHASRMMLSACFIGSAASDRPMDCTTCHNPHEGFRAAGPEYFDKTCRTCHDPDQLITRVSDDYKSDHTATSSCFACHMPNEAVNDVPHSSFTDHWIRVVGRTNNENAKTDDQELQLEPYFDRDRNSREGQIYEAVAYFVLGKNRGDESLISKGVRLLQERLTETDTLGDAWYQLGFGLVTLRRFEEAEEPLEKSVRLGPDVPERLNTLALLYERLGRSTNRIEGLFKHALEVQPAAAEIRVNYGRLLETLNRNEEARIQYQRAVDEKPSLATGYYNLGTLAVKEGELERGQEYLKQAIHLDPDYDDAYGNLAVVLASQNRTDEALVYFERAVEVAPDDPVALNNLGSFYLNAGQDQVALQYLAKAVDQNPDYVDALVNLAIALIRDGRDAEALDRVLRALSLDPDNLMALQVRDALR